MAATIAKLSVLVIFFFLSTNICHKVSASQRFQRSNQISNCSEMASISQCSQNPKCRWCRSQDLDDMCFSKSQARRLPQQVFTCD